MQTPFARRRLREAPRVASAAQRHARGGQRPVPPRRGYLPAGADFEGGAATASPGRGPQLPPPMQRTLMEALRAMPTTAKIRLVALAALAVFMVASVTVMGIETRQRYRTHAQTNKIFRDTDRLLGEVDAILEAGSAPPACVAFGQEDLTIGAVFSDDLFGVHAPGDPTTVVRFDLGDLSDDALVLSPTVTLTFQDASGEIAYLADIAPVATAFGDLEFVVQNQADPDKELRFDLGALPSPSAPVLTVQNAPGTVAYLADMIAAKNIFMDDEFTVHNAADATKRVMFDVGGVSDGASRVLAIPEGDGTIAYLADIAAAGFPLSDGDFALQHAAVTSRQMLFDLSGVSGSTTIEAAVQNRDGTIAYLDEIPTDEFVEVVITEDRAFPNSSIEAGGTLSALGDIYLIEISSCGGGGGGGDMEDGEGGGGGGSGGGVENFRIRNPADKYTRFDVVLGAAGAAGSSGGEGGTGGETMVTGVPVSGGEWHLVLRGFGGQGGQQGVTLSSGSRGGGGASSGGAATGVTLGEAGEQGGLVGGAGGYWATNFSPHGVPGPLTLPWRTGGGGGGGSGGGGRGAKFFGTAFSNDCPNSGGGSGCGANSMFGRGGTEGSPDGAVCAGGAGGSTANAAGAGGEGRVLVRYYFRNSN